MIRSQLSAKVIGWFFEMLNRAMLGNLPPFTAVAGVVEDDGRFLMLDRSDGLGLCFPGGLMNWRETSELALQREFLEETGCKIAITGLLGIYGGGKVDPRCCSVAIVYTAAIVGGSLRSSPEGKVVWLSHAEANSSKKLAFDHKLILSNYLISTEPN